jgi:heterodisulfide reductase subunit B
MASGLARWGEAACGWLAHAARVAALARKCYSIAVTHDNGALHQSRGDKKAEKRRLLSWRH